MKKSYSDKLRDPRWQKKRLEIFERDNFTCCDCEATDKTLQVHHCLYNGEPWETESQFLITVCEDCHENRQEKEADCRRSLAMIFGRCRNEEINYFATEICQVAGNDDSLPTVMDSYTVEYMTDARWFYAAIENEWFRELYSSITGTKPNWELIDKRKEVGA